MIKEPCSDGLLVLMFNLGPKIITLGQEKAIRVAVSFHSFLFFSSIILISTVFSKLNSHNDNIVSNNQQQSQQNHRIYSDLFSVNLSDDNPHFTKTKYDIDLIKNAVDIIKARSDLNYNILFNLSSTFPRRAHARPNTVMLRGLCHRILHIPAIAKRNIKYRCGICHKSVNKNQKAIECSTCLNWIHRKCNGLSLKEYECLVQEDGNVP